MAKVKPEDTFIQFVRDSEEIEGLRTMLLVLEQEHEHWPGPITNIRVVRMVSSDQEIAFGWERDSRGFVETVPVNVMWATETLQDMGWTLLTSADHFMIWQNPAA